MNKKFTVKIWDKLNIIFSALSLISFIPFVVFFILSLYDTNNGFFLGMSGIFASLFSAFFIAIIVRFVDLLKKKNSEDKALSMLNGHLIGIFINISSFFSVIKAFVEINENNTVSLPKGTVYYTNTEDEEMRNFMDIKEEFSVIKKNLDKYIEKCINSPFFFQCNVGVVNLIAKLQANGFTQNLYNISITPNTIKEEEIQYGFIYKEKIEFEEIFNELGILLKRKAGEPLRELTVKEKDEYIKFIEEKRIELSAYGLGNGMKSLGRKRIY